jgi:hypothetical protein
MSMFIKERNSLIMYTFHLALCRRCTCAQLIRVSRALRLTESSGERVNYYIITAEEAGLVDVRGPTYRYLCIFCAVPSASDLSRIRPIVTRVGDSATN